MNNQGSHYFLTIILGTLGEFRRNSHYLGIFVSKKKEKNGKIYNILGYSSMNEAARSRSTELCAKRHPEQKQAPLYLKVHGTRSLLTKFKKI